MYKQNVPERVNLNVTKKITTKCDRYIKGIDANAN